MINPRIDQIVNGTDFGVTFSLKTCKDYGIDWRLCLGELLSMGIKRYRIMTYWDYHEPSMGVPDFRDLNAQIDIIKKAGGRITLCLGMRQPRWPETHLPQWTMGMDENRREAYFLDYLKLLLETYQKQTCIESWQLENEFWNRSFGKNNNFSRARLVKEFELIKQYDQERPVIMSLANTYGYPIRAPKADIYGTTLYLTQCEHGRYSRTWYRPWYFALRRKLVKLLSGRELIIHELQAEPWGSKANWEMSDEEQTKSMSADKLKQVIDFAHKTGIKYMDLWGAEWWYWRKIIGKDMELWSTVSEQIIKSDLKLQQKK